MTVIFLLFGALAAAALGGGVIDQVRLRRSGYRPWRTPPMAGGGGHRFLPGSSSTFRGGAASPPVKLSGPSVVLTVDAGWAHLRGTGGMIDVWIPRDRVTEIRVVRLTTGTAVRFLSVAGDYDGVLFYSFNVAPLLSALRTHGWPAAPG